MKKRMAVFALFAVLTGEIAVSGKAVPAWKEVWERAATYEQQEAAEAETEKGKAEADGGKTAAAPDFTLYSQAAVLIDGDSGRVLYGKNENESRPMASTTKIMTCILALESGRGEDIVTISKKASSQPQVHLGAPAGRKFYLKDLLYSLMLESHNDAAVAIAEHVGGSTEDFAKMMNQKARDIGCTGTFFITPNGLDGKGTNMEGQEKVHSTTAKDLALIMRYCIYQSPKKEEFLAVTGTPSYAFSDVDGKGSYSCINHNAFLGMMEGAISGKTGFTGGAGYCYVGAVQNGKRNFIIALLGCGWPPHKTYKWSDARKLFQYGLDNYEYKNVWKDRKIPDIPVENGIPGDGDISHGMTVKAEIDSSSAVGDDGKKGLYLLLQKGEQPEITVRVEKRLNAPVYTGDVAGWAEYSLGGQTAASYPVIVKEGAEKINFFWCMKKIGELYLE